MRNPSDELHALNEAGLRRDLSLHDPSLIDFSSNDYLGLARHPVLTQAATDAIAQHGTGSRSARLLSGTHPPHRLLEEQLAVAKKTQAALTFSTGYATAIGTLTALSGKGDTLILDKLCHASLIDGARLSGATIRVYPHNHLEKLERLLKTHTPNKNTRSIIVTESIFSMDGDRAPLKEIVDLKEKYGAWLLVDEAHGFGILGPTGMGLAEELGLQQRIDLQMGTLSKAAGSAGGYIAANQDTIDLIANRARSFIYSTAPFPSQAAAASAAISLIQDSKGQQLRDALWKNIQLFAGSHTSSPIQPFIIGENEAALTQARDLKSKGFAIPAIRYPTVPKGTARLRISLSASHSEQDILQLKDHINTA